MTQKMKKTNSSIVEEEEATATTMEDVYYTMVSSPKRKRSVSIIDEEEERRETIEHTTRHSKRTKLGISNSNSNSNNIDSPTSQTYTIEENEELHEEEEEEKDTKEEEKEFAFHKLCDDTIEHIFSFLEPASILPLGVCSKSMNTLLSHMGKQTCDRVVLKNNKNNISSKKKNAEIEDFHGSQKNGKAKENNTITRSFKITLAERFLRDEGFNSIAELRDNSDDGQGVLTLESCVERALYYDVLHRWGNNNTNNKKAKGNIIDEVEDTERVALQRKILRTPLIDGLYLLGFQPEYLYAYKKHQSEIKNGQSAQVGQPPRSFDLEKTAREYGIVGVFDHAFNLIRHFNLDNSKKEAFEYICARNITTSNVLLLLKRTENILDTKDRADVARLIMTKVLLVYYDLEDFDVIEKAMQLYREVIQGTTNTTTAKKQKKTKGGVTASCPVPARTRTFRKNRRSNDIHHFNNDKKNSQSVEHNDNDNKNGNDDVTTIPTLLLEHALEIANSITNRPTKSFCLEAIAMKYCVLNNNNNNGGAHTHAHTQAHASIEKALEVTKKIPNVKNKNRAYSVLIESMLDNAFDDDDDDEEKKEDVIQQALEISELITNKTSVDYVLRNICIKCCRNLLTATRDTDTNSKSNLMIDEMLDIARRIKNKVIQSQALESIALAAFKTETTTTTDVVHTHQHTTHHNPDRALSILKEINNGDIHCRCAIERTLEFIVGCTFETHGIEEALKISKSFSSSDDGDDDTNNKIFLDKCLQTICARACEKKMMKEVIQLGSLMTSYQSKFYILCKVYVHSIVRRSVNDIIQYARACFTVDSERDARLADLVRKACVDNEILVAIELAVNGIKNNTHRRSCIRYIARHSIERRLYDDISKVLSPSPIPSTSNENGGGGVLLEVGSSNYMLFLDICFEFRYMNICDCHMEYSCGLEQLANISSCIPCDKMKSRAKQHLVDEYCQYAILLDDWNTSIAQQHHQQQQQQQEGSSINANPPLSSSLFVAADDMVKEAMNIAQTIPLKRYENKCAIHIKSCLSVLMMRAAKRMN